MSRAYRIRVSESIRRHVQIDDGIKAPLELLPVLSAGRMRALLADELEKRGFAIDGATARRDEGDGVILEVDLEAGEVILKIEGEETIAVSATTTATSDGRNTEHGREALKKKLSDQLEKAADKAQEDLQQKATAKLEERLRDVRAELDQVINRVTADALKERASQMGEIEELKEDAETGSMTIKVRL